MGAPKCLYIHVSAFMVVNISLFAMSVHTDGGWFNWLLIGWGAGLGVHALGAYGLHRARRTQRSGIHYADAATKILIVGGGFGGLAAARELVLALDGSQKVGVALLDRVNFSTFWPMVPSAISGNIEVRHVARSIRRVIEPLGAEFFLEEVTGVDFDAREVKTREGAFRYDYLILAPGSRTTFFGVACARENAIDLKDLRDALRVRDTIIDRFEEAERLRGDLPDGLLTFVFVGGGPTGVEGVADAHDPIHNVLRDDYPEVDFDNVRMILVNAGEHILKGIDPSLAHAAQRRLASQRVEILDNVKATEVRPDAVVLSDGRTIPTHTVIWVGGIEPPPFVGELDVPKDRRGRILVDEFLRVKDRPGVYAVGDSVSVDYEGPPVPALAAEQEGATAARNVAAQLNGYPPTAFRYRSLGQLVDLGTSSAVGAILGVRFTGLLGALV
jgi:NADH dehydrogenase